MLVPEFTAPSYGDRTLNEVQRCVNWYPEKTPNGWVLVGAPGLSLVAAVGNNEACRGAYFTSTGRAFSVHDNDLYEVGSVGPFTDRGDLTTTTGDVRFCDNGIVMLIVDGSDGYVYTLATNSMATISDGNFPASPNWCCFKDGYFIVTETGSDTFYLSQLNDPTDWTPASSAIAESSGDNLHACVALGNEVLMIGLRTIEPWYNTGNASFPFERITGGIKKMGTVQPLSIATDKDTLYMVAYGDGMEAGVWAIGGGGIRKVSPPYVDSALFAGVLHGFVYQHEGHAFYQVGQSTRSWVYDITDDAWHERDSNVSSFYVANRLMTILNRGDVVPLGFDRVNGNVYSVVNSTNTENGTDIRRIKDFGPIGDGTTLIRHDRIEILLEVDHDSSASYTLSGVLSWSDDGGLSFSSGFTLSKAITSGTTAQLVRLYANRLGSSRKRIYRWTMTGPAARIVLKTCDLALQGGRH